MFVCACIHICSSVWSGSSCCSVITGIFRLIMEEGEACVSMNVILGALRSCVFVCVCVFVIVLLRLTQAVGPFGERGINVSGRACICVDVRILSTHTQTCWERESEVCSGGGERRLFLNETLWLILGDGAEAQMEMG